MSIEAQTTLPYPTTAEGKRNWAFSAVHPGETPSSFETIPQSEGSFGDLIDIINPLQHLPVVGSLYRAATGDTMGGPARILGGLLFGGPLGLLAGIGSTILAEISGGDVGEQVLAMAGVGNGGATNQSAAAQYESTSKISTNALFSTATKI